MLSSYAYNTQRTATEWKLSDRMESAQQVLKTENVQNYFHGFLATSEARGSTILQLWRIAIQCIQKNRTYMYLRKLILTRRRETLYYEVVWQHHA